MAQKEDVLLEYGVQRSFENSPSDMDMDFNDVFGGPPRRFSIQESRTRYSFNDPMESEEDSATSSRSSWAAGLVEKPVFGAETSNRRRNGNDFYDDIFKADESYSSPRRSDYKEPFGSNPGSRVLSPVRPLSPKIEPFGTSLPVQFSLPAKLTKPTDVPLFVSGSNSPQKKREKELKNDASTFYRQSPLSREVTVSSDELSYMSESVDKNGESMEDLSDDYQFHFSIYKWAGKGVPIRTPLKGGLHFKSYEKIKMERCSSTNGRIENDNMDISSPLGEKLNMSKDPNIDSSRTTSENQSYGISRETLSIPKSESLQSVEDTAAVDGHSLRTKGVREKSQLRQKSGLFEGIQVENPKDSGETTKDKMKPLSEFLVDYNEQQGKAKIAQETEGSNVKASDNVKKVSDGVDKNLKKRDAEVSDNMQKTSSEAKRKGKRGLDKKTVVDRGVNSVNKGSPLGSPLRSTENSTKAGIKGKVQDFVKMFNHEVHSTPREGASRSKSFRWKTSSNSGVESEKSFSVPSKASSSSGAEDEKNFSKPKASEKVQLPTVNKMHDPTQNVEQNLKNQEKTTEDSQTKAPTQTKGDQNLSKQEKAARDSQKKKPASQAKDYPDQKAAPSANESKREDRKASVGNMDDLFGGNYVVEEIYEDQSKGSQTNDNSADIQASDAKIRQWSQGRKGNIRSLLSTLQLVLWPESGWKPVALVDLIEGSSVKRSYQRALLYLHPDKLQQKGAVPHQKYIAEKVFDILQEAWDHFNSLGL